MLSCLLLTIATIRNYQPQDGIGYHISASFYKYLKLQCICVKREIKLYILNIVQSICLLPSALQLVCECILKDNQ